MHPANSRIKPDIRWILATRGGGALNVFFFFWIWMSEGKKMKQELN